jgi:hypothetical protein
MKKHFIFIALIKHEAYCTEKAPHRLLPLAAKPEPD